MSSPKISCAIPIHNMQNAEFFLRRNLDAIIQQSYENVEVVITDNSPTDLLWHVIKTYGLDIKYHHNKPNPKNGMATNTNEALKRSTGQFIKIIYMDDYLAHKDALKVIAESFTANWLATGCLHDNGHTVSSPHYPTFKPKDKDNFIGSPSVITIKNDLNIYMDESLDWLPDFDWYKRLNMLYGAPQFLDDLNVIIGIHGGQMTNIISKEQKQKEVDYVNKKHA